MAKIVTHTLQDMSAKICYSSKYNH